MTDTKGEELKACPFCGEEVHADDVKRGKAYGGITYPCGTRRVLKDIFYSAHPVHPNISGSYTEHIGVRQSKDCEIVCLKKQVAELNRRPQEQKNQDYTRTKPEMTYEELTEKYFALREKLAEAEKGEGGYYYKDKYKAVNKLYLEAEKRIKELEER